MTPKNIIKFAFSPIMGDLYWLPVLCVVVFSVADPLGLGSIPFLYSAEFFPTEMRSILSGVTAGLSNLEMFLVVKVHVVLHLQLLFILRHHRSFIK